MSLVPAEAFAMLASPRIRVVLSRRDAVILRFAEEKLGSRTFDFGDAVAAIHASTMEAIPAGRVFLLGYEGDRPVFGSAISGIGVVEQSGRVRVVRVMPGGGFAPIRWLGA